MEKVILHKELANTLRTLLEDEAYTPHVPFLSLREISKRYDVTPSTALKAVSQLAQQGYLYIEHGKGSFVAPRISTRNILLVIDIGYSSGAMSMFKDGLRNALETAPEYIEVQETSERFLERLPELKFYYPKLDGIIFFRRIDTYLQSQQTLQQLKIPTVFYGSSQHADLLENKNCRLVPEDRVVNTALSYLTSKGHKKIGLVDRATPATQTTRAHLFLEWMCEHDLPVNKGNVLFVERASSHEMALGYRLNGFSKDTDATALFCVDDFVARRAMNFLVKKGVRIPQDLSIIGVNNYPFCDETITPLSSIDIPWLDDGEAVGHHLLSLIKDPDTVLQHESCISLAERFSTMP